jgi:hypothetical protein
MNFLKVTADICSSQGSVINNPKTGFYLNTDNIVAIRDKNVIIKGGNILRLHDIYVTNIQVAKDVNLDSL